MSFRPSLLVEALRHPQVMAGFSMEQWDLVVRQGRHALLLPRLAVLLQERGLAEKVPEIAWRHLESARIHAAKHERTIRWEVNRLERIFLSTDTPIVLLKGGAYLMADLPPAQGRVVSDLDILVPRAALEAVEKRLLEHGWEPATTYAYDQRYYRQWMHEIPPLRHRLRRSVMDVHHNILPLTNRLCPDAEQLLARAQPLPAPSRLAILSRPDMILHSATHLFHEGEFEHGLRDMVDLDLLLRHFSGQDSFFEELWFRAQELKLERPLYYACRYASELFDTPMPPALASASSQAQPWAPTRLAMDMLLRRGLAPDHASCDDAFTGLARNLLYLRAHYLRMPVALLLPHLIRKSWRGPEQP